MPDDSVVIKGTRDGLTVFIEKNDDFDNVRAKIYRKLAKGKGFFEGGKVKLELKEGSFNNEQYEKLEKLFTEFGMDLLEASSPKTIIFPKPHRKRVLLLKKTVRSGQKISYNGSIVIIGDANPGSELVATGDIIVMGALRGMAHAGAIQNDTTAMVVAVRLQPTQLRIANVISRPPEGKQELPQIPEIARLKNNVIVIDPYYVLNK